MKQLALDIVEAPQPALDNFVAGANGELLAHLRLCFGGRSGQAPASPVPTYLWGGHGSGKTHLLLAARHALQASGRSSGWIDAQAREPGDADPQWAAVILDDVQAYSPVQQQAAFRWIVNAMSPASGPARLILAAGTAPPADLPLRDDLRSRLGWGHAFRLEPPDDAARRAILRAQAHARGTRLSDEVLDYVLVRFARDLSHLSALLARLDAYALRRRRPLTIALLREMMDQESGEVA